MFVLSSKLFFYYLFIEHQASVGGSGKNSKSACNAWDYIFAHVTREKFRKQPKLEEVVGRV